MACSCPCVVFAHVFHLHHAAGYQDLKSLVRPLTPLSKNLHLILVSNPIHLYIHIILSHICAYVHNLCKHQKREHVLTSPWIMHSAHNLQMWSYFFVRMWTVCECKRNTTFDSGKTRGYDACYHVNFLSFLFNFWISSRFRINLRTALWKISKSNFLCLFVQIIFPSIQFICSWKFIISW